MWQRWKDLKMVSENCTAQCMRRLSRSVSSTYTFHSFLDVVSNKTPGLACKGPPRAIRCCCKQSRRTGTSVSTSSSAKVTFGWKYRKWWGDGLWVWPLHHSPRRNPGAMWPVHPADAGPQPLGTPIREGKQWVQGGIAGTFSLTKNMQNIHQFLGWGN